jgi:hypothetical protein
MHTFQREAKGFARRKQAETADAGQTVALHLLGSIDLAAALAAAPSEKARLIERIERLIQRERLKGLRRHWAYDLNRHIALKQALDRLRPTSADDNRRAEGAIALTAGTRARCRRNGVLK